MAYEKIVDTKKDKVHAQWKKEGREILTRDGILHIDASGGNGFIPLNAKAFNLKLPKSMLDALAFRMPINFRDEVC